MKILVCGHRSFAATGLSDLLSERGHEVDCFSRGDVKREGSIVTGDVFAMRDNPFLADRYDIVFNFILLKEHDTAVNLAYIQELLAFCARKKIKRLVQISSISVYPNDAVLVDEETAIENRINFKGPYAALKIAVDHFLLDAHTPFDISFVRPGYIVDGKRPQSFAGIVLKLPLGMGVLMGAKRTPLPLLERRTFHAALAAVVEAKDSAPVYLMFSNKGETKYGLAKLYFPGRLMVVPERLVKGLVCLAVRLRLLSKARQQQIAGLFKTSRFDSHWSAGTLKMDFDL